MILLACRGCGVIVAEAESLMTPDEWRAGGTFYERRVPFVPEGRLLQWSEELWTSDNRWLPFTTASWIVAPSMMRIPLSEDGNFGCCGVTPVRSDDGFHKNQFCTCIAALGWINTDCFVAEFVALDNAVVEAVSD